MYKKVLAALKKPLRSTFRSMKPSSLAETRQYIISENNSRHLQKPNYDITNHKNNQRSHQPAQHYGDARHNCLPLNIPQLAIPTQEPFPRGPINRQPALPQILPTNPEVFGPPRNPNVWKPNNQNLTNPMSGVFNFSNHTARTIIPNPRYQIPRYRRGQ